MPPKSKSYVHCKLCSACVNATADANCLNTPALRTKCKSAMRQCDLVRHNSVFHDGAPISFHGQETRPRSAMDMFRAMSPPFPKRHRSASSTAEVEDLSSPTPAANAAQPDPNPNDDQVTIVETAKLD